jgi:hypothetical protein
LRAVQVAVNSCATIVCCNGLAGVCHEVARPETSQERGRITRVGEIDVIEVFDSESSEELQERRRGPWPVPRRDTHLSIG